MGLKTIMDSKEIFLIAQGKSKWDIIRAFMERLLKKYHHPYYRDMRT